MMPTSNRVELRAGVATTSAIAGVHNQRSATVEQWSTPPNAAVGQRSS
jgi:hypothetical protein